LKPFFPIQNDSNFNKIFVVNVEYNALIREDCPVNLLSGVNKETMVYAHWNDVREKKLYAVVSQ